ncbi:MAG TPA: hypothetical protein PL002_04045 [Flavobacteriales bacterium]|nr:hypothetical protein [Flavobacteriales bacterium]
MILRKIAKGEMSNLRDTIMLLHSAVMRSICEATHEVISAA